MGWNKNTTSASSIDTTLKVLKELGESYSLKEIGIVTGYGLNDDLPNDESKKYKLRRLEYKDKVIIEQIIRNTDCDINDVIISKEFKKGEEPKDFELERTYDNDLGKYVKEGDEEYE